MTSAEFRGLKGRGSRGKSFEWDLERTHEYYRKTGIATVRKNDREWVYTSQSDRQRLLLKTNELTAKCDNGRVLVARKSKVDFEGNFGSRYIAFDAKETSEASLPLKNIKRHQVEQLVEHERTGALAGFMVRFSSVDGAPVYFLPASMMHAYLTAALYRKGRKSVPISAFEGHGTQVFTKDGLIDWASTLR